MSTETRHARYDDWYCECGVKDCPDLAAAETAAADRARQDAADGAALRELREAIPGGTIQLDWWEEDAGPVHAVNTTLSRGYRRHPSRHSATGPTLEAAARACLPAVRDERP